jgi:hypothetical protein
MCTLDPTGRHEWQWFIANTLINRVPPNLQFEIDDLEQPWNFSRKFDYIHSQLMIGAFSDWPKFCRQSFE